MELFSYTQTKYSGVDYLGDIPSHWETRRLKFYSERVYTGSTPPSSESKYYLDPTEDWFTPSDFTDEKLILSDSIRKLSIEAIEDGVVKRFPQESILVVGIGATLGKIGLAKSPFLCNQQINVIIPASNMDANFLAYSLRVKVEVMKVISNATTLGIMNQEKTKLIKIAAPEKKEQTQIAKFLDYKTAQIDRLIEKKKALIEKLHEQRIAMVTQAVTKGLNPDAPMKDSEVDWLGEIPEHWEVARLRFSIKSNPVKSEIIDIERNDMVSFVPMDAVGEYGGIRLDTNKILDDVYDGYTYFRDNDVVIAKITPCFENGKGALACDLTNGIAFGTTELHVMRPLQECSARWLFYLSISHPFREIGASEMFGAGGQKRVPESFIKNFRLGIPTFEEQEKIANYLDTDLVKMTKMLSVTNKTIEKLNEYRTALITAAVTGKIDVQQVEVPQEF
ncbi:MAG TPA: hypothetical protein DCL39_07535 [Alteromonas macleodii]|nr:hypothetical protein [Alteromonas macleodii]|tara:strand:- start:5597 stop:6943 length:1347 start_codon:yes stop_codon:yes gene_type:complete